MRSRKTRTKRAMTCAVTTALLAVPASALALSGATETTQANAAVPVSMRVSPRHTTVGHPVAITGATSAADAGHRAVLETRANGATRWTTVTSAPIGPDGRFQIRTALRSSGLVRVVDMAPFAVAATATPAAVTDPTGGVASSAQRVAVAARLRVPVSSLDVLAGSAVLVHGWLNPARAGRQVRVQGHAPGGWQTLASGRTGPTGAFRVSFHPSSGLERRLRVSFPGDGANAAITKGAGALTVYGTAVASWYDDSGSTACGFHAGYGVANVSLPCGTKVRFRYGGRSVTATVDDRGPYVGGRQWDLNQNTAAALGFGGVGTVWVSQ